MVISNILPIFVSRIKVINMEEKKLDAIYSEKLVGIIDKLNTLKVPNADIVNIFQNIEGTYIAIFYK